jgi:hypothetical protein
MKNFNKRGQLISTLLRTFYEASAAVEEDRRRRRGRGDSTEEGGSTSSLASFTVAVNTNIW